MSIQRHNMLVVIYAFFPFLKLFDCTKKHLVTSDIRQPPYGVKTNVNDKSAGKCAFAKYKREYIWCLMNTLEKYRKKYCKCTLSVLRTFAKHAERKRNNNCMEENGKQSHILSCWSLLVFVVTWRLLVSSNILPPTLTLLTLHSICAVHRYSRC